MFQTTNQITYNSPAWRLWPCWESWPNPIPIIPTRCRDVKLHLSRLMIGCRIVLYFCLQFWNFDFFLVFVPGVICMVFCRFVVKICQNMSKYVKISSIASMVKIDWLYHYCTIDILCKHCMNIINWLWYNMLCIE